MFENVPVDKLQKVKIALERILKNIYDGEEPYKFNMKRMKTVIQRQKLETLTNLENQPHDSIAFWIIGDMLYGQTTEDVSKKLKFLISIKPTCLRTIMHILIIFLF